MPYLINNEEVSIAEAGRQLGISRARAHKCHHDGSLQYRLDALSGADPRIPFGPTTIPLSLACKVTRMDPEPVITKAASGKLTNICYLVRGFVYGIDDAMVILDCTKENVRLYVRSDRIEKVLEERILEQPKLQKLGIKFPYEN